MKDRIREVMEYTKMTQQEFSNKIGISPASLSSIFTGRTRPTLNHVQAIHKAFPEINLNWLQFGEGAMFTSSAVSTSEDGAETPVNAGEMFGGGAFPSAAKTPAAAESRAQSNLFDSDFPLFNSRPASVPSNVQERRTDAKYFDKIVRKIKEIRVFYDDGTYESFAPAKN